jgi:hypothetical protein
MATRSRLHILPLDDGELATEARTSGSSDFGGGRSQCRASYPPAIFIESPRDGVIWCR